MTPVKQSPHGIYDISQIFNLKEQLQGAGLDFFLKRGVLTKKVMGERPILTPSFFDAQSFFQMWSKVLAF